MSRLAIGKAGCVIDADFCVVVEGGALAEAGYQNGDVIFIKSQSWAKSGELALVRYINNPEELLLGFYYEVDTPSDDSNYPGELRHIEIRPAKGEAFDTVIMEPRDIDLVGIASGVYRAIV